MNEQLFETNPLLKLTVAFSLEIVSYCQLLD